DRLRTEGPSVSIAIVCCIATGRDFIYPLPELYRGRLSIRWNPCYKTVADYGRIPAEFDNSGTRCAETVTNHFLAPGSILMSSLMGKLFVDQTNRANTKASYRARLMIHRLEDRTVPNTYMVTTTADSGAGSLRQAVADSNSNAGLDDIVFSAGLFGTPQ